jgi:hypothetical protein
MNIRCSANSSPHGLKKPPGSESRVPDLELVPTKATNHSKATEALKITNQGTGVDTRRRRRSFPQEHGRES